MERTFVGTVGFVGYEDSMRSVEMKRPKAITEMMDRGELNMCAQRAKISPTSRVTISFLSRGGSSVVNSQRSAS